MSGPVPMSPSTAPDSTVSQGSASSAPAGMVSGNDGAVNAGTTPVYHMGDPLQGSGDPWAGTAPWLSFSIQVCGEDQMEVFYPLVLQLALTGQSTGQSAGPVNITEHTSQWSYVCNAARVFWTPLVVQEEVQEEFL